MNEWQPISTAPKDGTHILVCRAWDADGKPIGDEAWGVFVHNAAWWGNEEGWIVYCSMIQDPRLYFEPTHWMALPDPPTGNTINERPQQ
jgi:hypothetical protein